METNLERLEQMSPNRPELYAYKSAYLGFQIALMPIKSMRYGPSSLAASKKAIELAPKNITAQLVYGQTLFYMPEVFGGSKRTAIEHYLIALKEYELCEECSLNNWNYLSLLVTIGQAYEQIEIPERAHQYYLKALQVAPNFLWVRDTLLPQLNSKLNSKK